MTDIKQLLKEFERFAHGQNLHSAFADLLNWTLLPFKMCADQDEQNGNFEAYKTHPKITQLTTLITIIGDLSEGFSDPLGELYMQAISNGHNGQYFTPEPICGMISAMTIGEGIENRETICDPACGSGRMLLAAAKQNRHSKFYGADLDNTCCKMALVNMLLNSLKGEVAHMNTLSNEFYTGYSVNTTIVDGYQMPYYIEFTEPLLSYIWLKPNQVAKPKPAFSTAFHPVRASHPINGIQGTLF
ncbi:N-6 DNA methylase [Mucilaginibacter sp.]|uniref:N-6 DNA methylase n=1 Tax=Mucilaginibacter sp. TaxID=1882438 RepID=UPI0025E9139D|nr:N-6 DNA methylase [Mucilaginibacter sp.]